MLVYTIDYAEDVEDSMKKFPKRDRKAIYDKIDGLKADPRPNGVEPLKGAWKGLYRVRVGNYRVVYVVQDKKLLIVVVKVAKRGEVYKVS